MTDSVVVSHRKVVRGSDRSFGLVFAAVFLIIALFPLLHWNAPRLWSLAIAACFAGVAFLAPGWLRPLNALWYKFGLLLHAVVNPIIMFLLFCVAFVPIGLIMRLRGKDLLRLKLDRAASSYWIAREPSSPPKGSMTKQF